MPSFFNPNLTPISDTLTSIDALTMYLFFTILCPGQNIHLHFLPTNSCLRSFLPHCHIQWGCPHTKTTLFPARGILSGISCKTRALLQGPSLPVCWSKGWGQLDKICLQATGGFI